MNTNTISKVSQIVFALLMAFFGVAHFMNGANMAGYVPSYMPGGGALWVYLTGAALVLAGVALIIDKQARLASYLLGAMLIIFVLTLHLPAFLNAADEAAKNAAMPGLLKDLCLAAAAFFIGSKNN